MRKLLALFAMVTFFGCSSSLSESEAFEVLVEPSASMPRQESVLYTVENLQRLMPIQNVTITDDGNGQWAKDNGVQLKASDLQPLLAGATPVGPDDPLLLKWHYAPWVRARFDSVGRRWSVILYLGGLGFIEDDQGRSGAFRFEFPEAP